MEQEKKQVQVKLETLEAQLKEWGVDLEKFGLRRTKPRTRRKPISRGRLSRCGPS